MCLECQKFFSRNFRNFDNFGKVMEKLLIASFSVTVHTLSSRYDIGKVTDRKEFSKTRLLSATTVKISSSKEIVIVTF